MPKRILYWFRNDLRLHDNEGFLRAVEAADEVLPVFVFEPRWFDELPELGFHKTGIHRATFLLESVADLRRSLQQKGGDLIIRVGHSEKILAQLAEDIEAEAVYSSKEVTQEETDTESDLSKRLKPLNIDLELFWVSTLYHARDLPFWVSRLPTSFAQYRTQVESQSDVRKPLPAPDQVRLVHGIDSGNLPQLTAFGFSDDEIAQAEQPDSRASISVKGGESEGLSRLNRYIWQEELVKSYQETRNGFSADGNTSKFSTWLATGCLSPRLIYQELKRFEHERLQNESISEIIIDLIWRDFFRFTALRYGTRIFKPSGIRHDLNRAWLRDTALFHRWAQGQTGIPLVDANMRKLNVTGFMSDRGRQVVSSFLLNDLGVNWTWGAAYFESQLIDYDPCSNWGNWNYMADLSNDPDKKQHVSINDHAIKHDADGNFVRTWLPELSALPAQAIHSVYNLSPDQQRQSGVVLGETYPLPIINLNA
ncbi:DASH family cryptochrome [Spirosoma terrae]|uniref:Cryptochrome DASH n=1 Tax=Spirosoma terrae TaxID=1968276 RepID=A0A6L9LBT2_9BACT|nr:DASH family cryptochrome [Spirosoma terrae]NDU98015.1 DASH family cryptochrome [Spirosoma terrae]